VRRRYRARMRRALGVPARKRGGAVRAVWIRDADARRARCGCDVSKRAHGGVTVRGVRYGAVARGGGDARTVCGVRYGERGVGARGESSTTASAIAEAFERRATVVVDVADVSASDDTDAFTRDSVA
jgi:hypothetical protein